MDLTPMELIKFVQAHFATEREQTHALAALADAPPEDFQAQIQLPVQNPIPAFKLGDGGFGSMLLNQNYGVPAPVIGEVSSELPSIGQLLIGESNASAP